MGNPVITHHRTQNKRLANAPLAYSHPCHSHATENQQPTNPTTSRSPKGTKRFLQILISESTHLIWVLRCERTIQNKSHSHTEIESRWLQVINARLTEDNIIAARIRRDKSYSALIASTWEPILSRDSDLPNNQIQTHYHQQKCQK